jgi:predicted HTH domain antitoxin
LLIDEGLKHFLALKAFSNGDLSLGELAACFGQTRAEVLQTLGKLHIPIADYSIGEELDSLAALAL